MGWMDILEMRIYVMFMRKRTIAGFSIHIEHFPKHRKKVSNANIIASSYQTNLVNLAGELIANHRRNS
jgi:hypothetical protein